MNRCPNRTRHWFSLHGMVGVRSPVCVRCGAPNPRPLTADEQATYEYWKEHR